jgi:dTDP-4-dehydrorhamnose reductase
VLSRVEFAERIARTFGLTGEIVPVKTADVALPAPRPLRGGLVVARAARLLRNQPLGVEVALGRFVTEWKRR